MVKGPSGRSTIVFVGIVSAMRFFTARTNDSDSCRILEKRISPGAPCGRRPLIFMIRYDSSWSAPSRMRVTCSFLRRYSSRSLSSTGSQSSRKDEVSEMPMESLLVRKNLQGLR